MWTIIKRSQNKHISKFPLKMFWNSSITLCDSINPIWNPNSNKPRIQPPSQRIFKRLAAILSQICFKGLCCFMLKCRNEPTETNLDKIIWSEMGVTVLCCYGSTFELWFHYSFNKEMYLKRKMQGFKHELQVTKTMK